MTDWYYHAPGQGKVGPLSADEMRARYRDRRITRDMLAWHEGLREWQPVERLIEELGLSGVLPDSTRPPPVPPRPAAATASHAARPSGLVEPPPSSRTGCIIAAIVVGIIGLVVVAILAAIALPAYQDYVKRTKGQANAAQGRDAVSSDGTFDEDRMADTDALARELVTLAMREFYVANGNTCPDTFEFERIQVRVKRLQGSEEGWFTLDPARPESGQCAYDVRYMGLGPGLKEKHLRYEVTLAGDDVAIACSNRTLPSQHLPPHCLP